MANVAIVPGSGNADNVLLAWNPVAAAPARPGMAWPATGGNTGAKENMFVYVPVVTPSGSIVAGGPTTGQLFPVGNR